MNHFTNLPQEVIYLKMAGALGFAVRATDYKNIITKYPEHFPEEAEKIKKWEAIPESVHQAYWSDVEDFHNKLWKNEPKVCGFKSIINNDEAYQKYSEAFDRLQPLQLAREEELHKKHYSKYGI